MYYTDDARAQESRKSHRLNGDNNIPYIPLDSIQCFHSITLFPFYISLSILTISLISSLNYYETQCRGRIYQASHQQKMQDKENEQKRTKLIS